MSWNWRFDAILAEATEMKRNRALNVSEGGIDGFSRCDATRQISHGGSPIAVSVLVYAN